MRLGAIRRVALLFSLLLVTMIGFRTYVSHTGHVGFKTGAPILHVTGDAVRATGMSPGDVRYTTITVANRGTVPLRYTLRTSGSGVRRSDLSTALRAEMRAVATACGAEAFSLSADRIAAGQLGSVAVSRPRTVRAGERDVIRTKVALPRETRGEFQGIRAEISFSVFAVAFSSSPQTGFTGLGRTPGISRR